MKDACLKLRKRLENFLDAYPIVDSDGKPPKWMQQWQRTRKWYSEKDGLDIWQKVGNTFELHGGDSVRVAHALAKLTNIQNFVLKILLLNDCLCPCTPDSVKTNMYSTSQWLLA